MNGTWWTLVSVALGGVLGGGAQMLAGMLQSRRDRRIRDDQLRRGAYQFVLSALRAAE